jgi:hypothetical protein
MKNVEHDKTKIKKALDIKSLVECSITIIGGIMLAFFAYPLFSLLCLLGALLGIVAIILKNKFAEYIKIAIETFAFIVGGLLIISLGQIAAAIVCFVFGLKNLMQNAIVMPLLEKKYLV